MSTVEQANKISNDIKHVWWAACGQYRAELVIDWAKQFSIAVEGVSAEELYSAMSKTRFSNQGPADYLDMLIVLSEFVAVRKLQTRAQLSRESRDVYLDDAERHPEVHRDSRDREADEAGMSRNWNTPGKE